MHKVSRLTLGLMGVHKDALQSFLSECPSPSKLNSLRLSSTTVSRWTGRVQTVTEEHNGLFYRLIRAFHGHTGVPVVINTSFNVRGEPIVCTPQDAYRTFVNTGIDAMVIGNYMVTHKPGGVDYDAGMKRSVELEAGLRTAERVTIR